MDRVPHSLDLPMPGIQMRMADHRSSNPESQHFSVSNEHMGLVEPILSKSGFNTLMLPDNTLGCDESSSVSIRSSPNEMLNKLALEDGVMLNNMTGQNTSWPVKRKAEMGPMSNSSISLQGLLPNKHPAYSGARVSSHGFMQPPAPYRRTGPEQANSGSSGLQAQSALNKKTATSGSMPSKSSLQRGHPAKKQSGLIESASKPRHESSEAVRSKMRDSLASALALVSQKADIVSNTVKDKINDTVAHQRSMDSQASQPDSTMNNNVPGSGSEEAFPSKELAVVDGTNDSQVLSAEHPLSGSNANGGRTFQEFQYSSNLPDEDMQFSDNFFFKDDLLQGNGLSWALDFDMQMREGKEPRNSDETQIVKEEAKEHRDRGEVAILMPENLAFQIEAELFKLFGGVNKKYKEKGRSLLFNLKDRNNPELRERVMSGEISPKRLCSMSAEELASKELSEWRMAKAEEMAQMVVLPDTEVDVRRLVKKTHKGEYQVEFEHDDGIVEEMSGGTSVLTQPQLKKGIEAHSPSKASLKDEEDVSVQKNESENQDFARSLVIPTDGTDLMHGMMVDELKDTEFLPPIVSLDEFMESLNSEPPFENLSADGVQKAPVSHEESPKVVDNSEASNHTLGSSRDASSKKADVKKHKVDMSNKSSESSKQNVLPNIALGAENIWEGILQLTLLSSVTVRGLFQSGEKTSMKDWPTSLEIKGRVRLDAFEKFLQELPMSRTRAVMVLQFDLKDKSSEKQRGDFLEVVDSYVVDERLGFAEPAPGVELYLCPSTSRMAEMLNKHLPKECPQTNMSAENGLIGVVVWRRAHISNISSPNSSSHHKHSMKKQHSTPNRMQNSSNVNVNTPSRPPAPVFNNASHSKPEPQPEEEDVDDDDDIPPGFGPMAAGQAANKDDDDLPEFKFSGDLNPSVPRITSPNLHHGVKMTQRPMDQVRELIQKYGQSGTSYPSDSDMSLGIEPWVDDDDDDDDIPEWRPQAPHQFHHHHQPVVAHGHRPPLHLRPTNQRVVPLVGPQSPRELARPPPGGRWVQPPPGSLHGARWRPY